MHSNEVNKTAKIAWQRIKLMTGFTVKTQKGRVIATQWYRGYRHIVTRNGHLFAL
jgi:hypothetical protein